MSQELATESDPAQWPPGTVRFEEGKLPRATSVAKRTQLTRSAGESKQLILHPTPTSDPNDPLNWSTARKSVHFALVCLYTLLTFVQLDVGFTAWDQYSDELGFTYDTLNGSAAANYLGLALGCVALVPLVHKLGRRPIYLFSAVLQFVSCIWSARTNTVGDLYGSNIISGVGGAISETIVQITIADLFFVHNHATVNGLALLATFTGAYLGPVASGYVVENQGWRWVWWWCALLFGINLILVLVFFEESKYQRQRLLPESETGPEPEPESGRQSEPDPQPEGSSRSVTVAESVSKASGISDNTTEADGRDAELGTQPRPQPRVNTSIPMKPIRQRLAFATITEGSMFHDVWEPIVILFTFPAITYTAIAYGVLLAWFAVLISVQATYMFDEPYNFSSIGIGLMNIAPFVASIPGVFIGGYLNDKSIVWLARRNKGVYEPEMRLWMILPLSLLAPAGILMFGLGLDQVSFYLRFPLTASIANLSQGLPWPLLAVGFGLYGFCLTAGGVISLSYAMDCYHDVSLM